MQLRVKTKEPYQIEFVQDILHNDHFIDYCQTLGNQLVIVTDDTVNKIYGEMLQQALNKTNKTVHLLSFPEGEAHKTRETKAILEDELLNLKCKRDTAIIGFGGGI